MPIRICHLIPSLDSGGAERSLVNLVTGMDRNEFDNEVVTLLKPGPLAEALAEARIPVTSLGLVRHRPNPSVLLSLIRHLRAHRPAILQTWLYHADLLGTAAAFFARPNHLVWNVRCTEINEPTMPRSTRFLPRILAVLSRRPDAIIVNSQRGQKDHDQIGYRPKEWINIPNGVDLARFMPRFDERAALRARIGLSVDGIVIGFVARYHPMKDVETFLRAASLFQREDENARFVLCGDGLDSANAALTRLVQTLGLEGGVVLLGRRREMEQIYPTFNALTLCSTYGEGFPNVLGEAMACGVPCVTTKVGDSAEIVGDCGLIVPQREPEALARAWRTLLDTKSSITTESVRSRMATHYSLQRMCAHYESLYRSLVRKRPDA